MEPMSRKDARAAGLKHYFTGKPCPRGHVAPRFVSTGGCSECLREKKAENADRNAAAGRAYSAKYRAENAEVVRAKGRADYHANKQACRDRSRAWHEANQERAAELRKEFVRRNPGYFVEWRAAHKVERLACGAKRRASKRRAMPPWFGELDELVMTEAFDLAARRELATGAAWHVDHMIPLQAREASGLHCAANIQVIPALINLSKGCKMAFIERGQWVLQT